MVLKKFSFCVLAILLPSFVFAQVRINKQQHFPKAVPAGNYSGITPLGNDRYALVSDKSATDGYFIFHIELDSVTGRILRVVNEGFRSTGTSNRDQEGIAFFPDQGTLFVSGEADNCILEYTLDRQGATCRHTGHRLAVPAVFSQAAANYGFESLTYDAHARRFWTTTESTLPADGPQATPLNPVANRLRFQSFTADLQPSVQYIYEMDRPEARKRPGQYAMGVSELCAVGDGTLLVLEREFYVSRSKLGSFVRCKLYAVRPYESLPGSLLSKRLVASFRTRFSLFSHAIANYEGMCLGPRLKDGRRTLLMVSDSQDQYRGVLKDWFKTIVF